MRYKYPDSKQYCATPYYATTSIPVLGDNFETMPDRMSVSINHKQEVAYSTLRSHLSNSWALVKDVNNDDNDDDTVNVNGVCRVDITPTMSAGLRQLASSAAAACNSMTSVQSFDTLKYIMTSVRTAHYDTCQYTSDKVAVDKLKYDNLMCNKPPVSIFTTIYFFFLSVRVLVFLFRCFFVVVI